MTDYQGNAKKDKSEKKSKPEKVVERVTSNEVIVQKKPLGRKIKEMFIEADFKSTFVYLFTDVLIPAAKNTIVDTTYKGIDRLVYGDRAMRYRHGPGSHITYNRPVDRGMGGSPLKSAPPISMRPRSLRGPRDEFIVATREEADIVIERMTDIVDQYQVVSVADLNNLVGNPSSHTDEKWGWESMTNVRVIQVGQGYLIDLPQPEPI